MSDTEPTNCTDTTLSKKLAQLRVRIAQAEKSAGRTPGSVRLVAVSKTKPASLIREAIGAGVCDVGENYIQEAVQKIPEVRAGLSEADDARIAWHFIGHLQRNKAKWAVSWFDLIQTVDSIGLMQEIGKQARKQGKTQRILLEVRLGDDTGQGAARAGVVPQEVLALAEHAAQTPGIDLRGLMAVAPYGTNNDTARPYFAQVRGLWEGLPQENRHELSLGMTGDFEAAIASGATLIRIGTALFGERGPKL